MGSNPAAPTNGSLHSGSCEQLTSIPAELRLQFAVTNDKFPSQFPRPIASFPAPDAPMNRNLQLTIAWFILGFLLTGGAIWQAQTAVARELADRHRQLPPPLKTRRALRPPPSTAPVADYATRRAKGLSDREIGWIIDDFQAAGLDLGIRAASKEAHLAQRKAQDRWYRDVLAEAWSLTAEQTSQVTAKLAELYDQAKADFVEALNAGPQPIKVNDQWLIVTSADPIHRLIDANVRLQDSKGSFLPWNLCTMDSGLHMEPHGKNIDLQIRGALEESYDSVELPAPVRLTPAEPSLITVDQFLPHAAAPTSEEAIQILPAESDPFAQFRKLHPAQLKLLLLIAPEKTKDIRSALDAVK